MNEENKWIQPIMEGSGVIALTVLLGIVAFSYLPFLLILYPLGFIMYGVKYGVNGGVITSLLTALILGIIENFTNTYVLIILFTPLVITMIYSMKKRRRPLETLLTAAITFFASSLVLFFLADSLRGLSIVNELEESFKEVLFLQVDMLKQMGLSNYEVDKTRVLLQDAYKYIILILPSILMILALTISYLNYIVAVYLLRILGIGVLAMPWLHKFSAPNNFALGALVMFLGAFLMRGIDAKYYETISLNLIVLIGLVFILQGLAVVDFYLIKWKQNKFVRFLTIGLSVFLSPILTVISLLGGIDLVFDFRKIRRRKTK
ncbi:MAG: DUF2232 domain-containing protein [Gudongella sp.]|nr:DUF2232 domain-containing protein [Gudongella sp.]